MATAHNVTLRILQRIYALLVLLPLSCVPQAIQHLKYLCLSRAKHGRPLKQFIRVTMAWSIQLLVAATTLVVLVAVLCYPLRDDPGQAFVKALQAGELQANRLTWMKTLLRSITAMGEIVAEGYSRVRSSFFAEFERYSILRS